MPPWYRHRKEPNSIPAKQVLLLSLHWIDIKFRKSNGFCPKFKIFCFLRFKSAKYTLLTFLPLNIIEQFRRGANFYFLVRAIIIMKMMMMIIMTMMMVTMTKVTIMTMTMMTMTMMVTMPATQVLPLPLSSGGHDLLSQLLEYNPDRWVTIVIIIFDINQTLDHL